jgi:hypothetical protein
VIVVRTFSGNEIAAEAGIGQERLAWLVSVGIVRPQEPDVFCFGGVFRAKLLSAVLDAGIPESVLERAHPYTWTKPAEQVLTKARRPSSVSRAVNGGLARREVASPGGVAPRRTPGHRARREEGTAQGDPA